MVTFSVVDQSLAPPRHSSDRRSLARKVQLHEWVTGLGPGQVGAITPGRADTIRGLRLRLRYAARREGVAVECWTDDERVYFRRV